MSLESYRLARLDEARAAAERLAADARSAAAEEIAEASAAAAAVIAEARADGAGRADREMAVAGVRDRRRSRQIVLAARRRAYEVLREEALASASRLRLDPGYPALLDQLERLSRAQLGDGARIARDPADGGVVAEVDGCRVDYSLPALAERCLRGLGAGVEDLWR